MSRTKSTQAYILAPPDLSCLKRRTNAWTKHSPRLCHPRRQCPSVIFPASWLVNGAGPPTPIGVSSTFSGRLPGHSDFGATPRAGIPRLLMTQGTKRTPPNSVFSSESVGICLHLAHPRRGGGASVCSPPPEKLHTVSMPMPVSLLISKSARMSSPLPLRPLWLTKTGAIPPTHDFPLDCPHHPPLPLLTTTNTAHPKHCRPPQIHPQTLACTRDVDSKSSCWP